MYLFTVHEPPVFLITPESQDTVEGEKVKFTCKVRGKPLPEFSWFRDNELITPDDLITVQTKEKSDKLEVESVLSLKKTVMADESELYRIEAGNIMGSVTQSFALVVNKPPEFTQVPASVDLTEGENAELMCVVTGKPPPELTWYKDGNEISEGELANSSIEQDPEVRTIIGRLRIDPVILEHDGKYRLKASNSVGNVKSEFAVTG